jgi:hypothetical protein
MEGSKKTAPLNHGKKQIAGGVGRSKSYSSMHPANGRFHGPNCPSFLEIRIRVIFVLRIRHQGDSLVGKAGVACLRGARGTCHMIFAQPARKEWEQGVNTSDRRRAAAWQRRSSKATIVILRTGKLGSERSP